MTTESTSKKWYQDPTVIVAIISGIFGLITLLIQQNFKSEPGQSQPAVSNQVNVSPVFNNNISNTTPAPSSETREKRKSFSCSGVDLGTEMVNEIATMTQMIHTNSASDFEVSIGFFPDIEQLPNGLYVFHGGEISVQVNKKKCNLTFQGKLKPTLAAGNPKGYILGEINRQIVSLIKLNQEAFIKDISKCLQ